MGSPARAGRDRLAPTCWAIRPSENGPLRRKNRLSATESSFSIRCLPTQDDIAPDRSGAFRRLTQVAALAVAVELALQVMGQASPAVRQQRVGLPRARILCA